MTRHYRYVGPAKIAERVTSGGGLVIDSVGGLRDSLRSMDGYHSTERLTVTFVISLDGNLRIANRRSEHVMCAEGQPVLSAGEMTFMSGSDRVFVENVTNQSAGYCPEPESWPAVAAALDRIGIVHPESFEPAFVFRRCLSCSQINVIKDEWYVCDVCQSPLPQQWNFD